MNKIKHIGLCGRSGSGKGYVCSLFEKHGIPSIDTDEVYKRLCAPTEGEPSPLVCEITEAFGNDAIDSDGKLDRSFLSSEVFDSEISQDKLTTLNRITHSHILAETIRLSAEYAKDGAAAVIIDAPVLFESGFEKYCDKIIAVICDEEVRIRRIITRDGISREAAMRRLSTQLTDDELRARADYIADNSDGAGIEAQVEYLAAQLQSDIAE